MGDPGAARWGHWLRRYFGGKGGESVKVLTDIMPTVNLLEEAPELRYYRDERKWSTYANAGAGGAGTYATHQFANPSTSPYLVVISSCQACKVTNGRVNARIIASTAPAGALTGRFFDARCASDRTSPVMVPPLLWAAATPGVYGANTLSDDWAVLAAQFIQSPTWPMFILPPGGPMVEIQNTTANEALEVRLHCYDIPLHGSEEF